MFDQLNCNGVEFPVISVKDYSKIEAQNTININVFGNENLRILLNLCIQTK